MEWWNEWVKRNTLRWFGHIERMRSEKFVKKVYMSENVAPNSRGRPPGRWRDRVKEFMCERGATRGGGLGQAMRENKSGGPQSNNCSFRSQDFDSVAQNIQIYTASKYFC